MDDFVPADDNQKTTEHASSRLVKGVARASFDFDPASYISSHRVTLSYLASLQFDKHQVTIT